MHFLAVVLFVFSAICSSLCQIPENLGLSIDPGISGPFGFIRPNPIKLLGQRCQPGQCKAAFSDCIQGTCRCRPGFVESTSKKACIASVKSCPYGEGESGNPKSCKIRKVCRDGDCSLPPPIPVPFQTGAAFRKKRQLGGPGQVPFITYQDDCPEGFYCAIHNPTIPIESSAQGHCCPAPKPTCPVGKPMPNVKCGDGFAFCPSSHYCNAVLAQGSPKALMSACCPKACSDNAIFLNGTCYRIALAGESCEVDAQCAISNANCDKQQKICKCPQLTISQNGVCARVFCQGGNRLLNPFTNKTGDLVTCGDSEACPNRGYCARDHRICCPVPEPFCPIHGFGPNTGSAPGKACKPSSGDKSCGNKKFCFQYYYATEQDQGAVCCDEVTPPPGAIFGGQGPIAISAPAGPPPS